jgi:hypothetical protein
MGICINMWLNLRYPGIEDNELGVRVGRYLTDFNFDFINEIHFNRNPNLNVHRNLNLNTLNDLIGLKSDGG